MAHSLDQQVVTLGQILPDLSLQGWRDRQVGPLVQDSREIKLGDTFIALSGYQLDGARFIESAVNNGATLILIDGASESVVTHSRGVLKVAVPHLREQLSAIAGRWYGAPSASMQMVAITGTNGKTTCSHWLAQVLDSEQQPAASIGTLGYGMAGQEPVETGFTSPDPLMTQRILAELKLAGAQSVVMEASSHALDQGRAAAVEFDVAVFTNIGRDHLDYHGDLDAYINAKATLMTFNSLKAAVINIDDHYASRFIAALAPSVKLLTYGLDSAADFYCDSLKYHAAGISATLHSPEGSYDLSLTVWGEFNVRNVLAVIASAYALGQNVADVVAKLESLLPVPGRLQPVAGAGDIAVLVDFAHTGDALESVLQALRLHTTGRVWCVFGCGGDRDKGKRPLMAATAEALADEIVVTSDNPRSEDPAEIIANIMVGFSDESVAAQRIDRAEAIEYAITHAESGDCVLLAGKGHENYQLIRDQRLPFSDLAVAKSALLRRAGAI